MENPLYTIWHNMKNRTQVKTSSLYSRCGGAGIRMHKPWVVNLQAFEKWVKKNLGLPAKHETVRRIDIGKHFEPGNMERVPKNSNGGKRSHQQTSPEKILSDLLDGRTFKYVGQGKAKHGQPISADFVVPRLKLLIQVDGCYWHGCDLHSNQSKSERRKLQKKDARLTAKAESAGWTVVRVWEHEITDHPDKVVNKIKAHI